MSKDALIKDAINAIKNCDADAGKATIDKAKEEGMNLVELLSEGFSAGIREVGDAFGRGTLFLPELILAADIMKKMSAYIDEITPDKEEGVVKGTMVLATVEGDVHDIGKGIVVSLLRTQGINVVDLGRDVPVKTIVDKAEENNADIIGTSALLTTTMVQQKNLEDELNSRGIREKYKTMVGGAPVTQRWAKRIGATSYAEDAAEAVDKVLELLAN